MNHRERFKAVTHFKEPDYHPIFGNHGAPGFSMGPLPAGYVKLQREGMPDWVHGKDLSAWHRYWGVTSPILPDFFPAYRGGPGIRRTKRIEDGFEIIETETGAITRQVIDNDNVYSMPQFIRYDIRDRESWRTYRDLTAPGPIWEMDKKKKLAQDSTIG